VFPWLGNIHGLAGRIFTRGSYLQAPDSRLAFFQHLDDLLFTEPALLHGASPLVVLYPEKLSFGWTKFRGAGQSAQQALEVVAISSPGITQNSLGEIILLDLSILTITRNLEGS
jgi:hypothetical protein